MLHLKSSLPRKPDRRFLEIPSQPTLYFESLPLSVTDSKQLFEFGAKYGKVTKARVLLQKGNNHSNGIITYTNEQEALHALHQLKAPPKITSTTISKPVVEQLNQVLYHYVYPDVDNESFQSRGSKVLLYLVILKYRSTSAGLVSNHQNAATPISLKKSVLNEKANGSPPEATVADDVALRTGILSSLVKLVNGIQQLLPAEDLSCNPDRARVLFNNMERIITTHLLSPSAAAADSDDNYNVALTSSLRTIQGMKWIETRRGKTEHDESDSLTLSRIRLTVKLVHDSVKREAKKYGVEMV